MMDRHPNLIPVRILSHTAHLNIESLIQFVLAAFEMSVIVCHIVNLLLKKNSFFAE